MLESLSLSYQAFPALRINACAPDAVLSSVSHGVQVPPTDGALNLSLPSLRKVILCDCPSDVRLLCLLDLPCPWCDDPWNRKS
jgi:hypothetical protein